MKSRKLFSAFLILLLTSSVVVANDDIVIDDYLFNPASRFMSKDKWEKLVNDSIDEKEERIMQERMFGKAKVITVDTRDQKVCRRIEDQLREYSNTNNQNYDICAQNSLSPYTTITVYDNPYETKGISYSQLDKKSKTVVDSTRNLSILGLGVIGAIWMLPEDVSNWTEEKVGKKFGSKYIEHIKEGPIMDSDSPIINFVGHPYSGAIYYTVARHAGLTKMQSFGYSVFMSTAFWEYGVEAIFEEPSIQDLIITPVIGSLLGSFFENYTEEIKSNDGKAFGSKRVGATLMAIMNPVEGLMDGMNEFFKNDVIKDTRVFLYSKPKIDYELFNDQFNHIPKNEKFMGVGIEFKF